MVMVLQRDIGYKFITVEPPKISSVILKNNFQQKEKTRNHSSWTRKIQCLIPDGEFFHRGWIIGSTQPREENE